MAKDYFVCKECGRTLREEEPMTHEEYDQKMLRENWAEVGEHSDWWYERIAPLNLREGETVWVCRFCGGLEPDKREPTEEGRSVADLRLLMYEIQDASEVEGERLRQEKERLEGSLYDYDYAPYVLNRKNVEEKINTPSGTFHLYRGGGVRYEDVLRKSGKYYRVPVYNWEKVKGEFDRPTRLIEFFDESEGYTVEIGKKGKYDYEKQYGPRISTFMEFDTVLLRRKVDRLEEELKELRSWLEETEK